MGMVAAAMMVGGKLAEGHQAAAGRYEEAQANIAAGQQQAASQRTAQDVERRGRLAQSRAQAVSAASGAGTTDRTVVDIIAGIAQEGAYRSKLARYEGDDKARALRARGAAARFSGDSARNASYISAAASAVSGGYSAYEKGIGGTSMLEKYGGGGSGLSGWEGSSLENYGKDDRYG